MEGKREDMDKLQVAGSKQVVNTVINTVIMYEEVERKREEMDRALVVGSKQVVNVVVSIAGMDEEEEGGSKRLENIVIHIYIYITSKYI